ncbi:MAG: PQQ-binding-like beta-propeller repeat protein [Myxococcales bacterium]|nr:PQQ-binding-like beta-propeller repeat protein [Myxococcales bacterium]
MKLRYVLGCALALFGRDPPSQAQVPPEEVNQAVEINRELLRLRALGASPLRGPRARPSIRWRVRTRHRVYAAPAVTASGWAVFGSLDGAIHAVDADGVVRWSHLGRGRVFGAPAPFGELVVYGEDGGAFVALARGVERWRIGTPEDADAAPVWGDDGTVFLASREVLAVRRDGAVRWRQGLGGHAYGAPALSGDRVYVPEMQGFVSVFDRATGAPGARIAVGARVVSGLLVTRAGNVVVGAEDGVVRAFSSEGASLWSFSTEGAARGLGVRATPSEGPDGTIFVGAEDGGFYALRGADGVSRFRVITFGPVRARALVDAEGWSYVGSEDDRLYAITPEGQLGWYLSLGADIDSGPALMQDGLLVAGCDDGALYAVAVP